MEVVQDADAPTLAGGRVLLWEIRGPRMYAHDIPHPIGDPDDDDELPDEDDEDEEDDEEPLQVKSAHPETGSILHRSTFPFFLL